MSTLNQPNVSSLLDSLFTAAENKDASMRRHLADRTPEERTALLAGANTDYKKFYGDFAGDLFLPVSRETGRLLYVLARATHAKHVVEYGTSFGLSTIHLAAAVKDNGGGRVIGSEFLASKVKVARENLAKASLSEFVDIREGDALETLSKDLPETIDLVLLDGAKVLYPKILKLVEPRLSKTALIVADNADDSPEYLATVRDPKNGYLSLPFASDVELSLRVG
ncbi:MAG TPA: class I SAM-dependent methyltransferase [Polyangiaceae bacterium]